MGSPYFGIDPCVAQHFVMPSNSFGATGGFSEGPPPGPAGSVWDHKNLQIKSHPANFNDSPPILDPKMNSCTKPRFLGGFISFHYYGEETERYMNKCVTRAGFDLPVDA